MIGTDDLLRIKKLNKAMEVFAEPRQALMHQVVKMGYPVWLYDGVLPGNTAAVGLSDDGRLHYFWCRNFFDTLSPDGIAYVAAHETLHVLLEHCSRRGLRDPAGWNVACDIMVNSMLDSFYSDIFCPMPNELQDRIRAEMYDLDKDAVRRYFTTEEIYDHIMQFVKSSQLKAKDAARKKEGDDDGSEDISNGGTGDPSNRPKKKFKRGSVFKKGSMTPVGVEPLDDHGKWDTITREFEEKVQEVISDVLENEIQRNYGSGSSAEYARLKKKRVRPFPWQQLLRGRMASIRKPHDGESWARCHRKLYQFYPDVVLPGEHDAEKTTSKVLLTIDSSGSMSEDDIAECVAIVGSLPPDEYEVFVSWFDTFVYFAKDLTRARGRGGTNFQCIEQVARGKNVIRGDKSKENTTVPTYPDIIVVMTDGYAPCPKLLHPNRWVWLLTPAGSDSKIASLRNLKSTIWNLPARS